jgi:hypothetical protein
LSADLESFRSLSACPPLVSLHSKHHTTHSTLHDNTGSLRYLRHRHELLFTTTVLLAGC